MGRLFWILIRGRQKDMSLRGYDKGNRLKSSDYWKGANDPKNERKL